MAKRRIKHRTFASTYSVVHLRKKKGYANKKWNITTLSLTDKELERFRMLQDKCVQLSPYSEALSYKKVFMLGMDNWERYFLDEEDKYNKNKSEYLKKTKVKKT